MAKIAYTSQIGDWIASLAKYGKVIAPVVRHAHSGASKVIFDVYEKGDHLELDYPTTVLPPKEFLLPSTETILEFEDGEAKAPTPEKTVLLGLSYEDLEGISKLEEIFARPVKDEVFSARKKNTIVIAADRYSPPKRIGFDVYLQKITSDRYAAFAGSPTGKKLLSDKFFKSEKVTVPRVVKKDDPLLSHDLLARAVDQSRGSKIWDRLAHECFACGICSFTCPLCYCFETEDRIDLSEGKAKGRRERTWSTCFSEDFARTAGHNFRPERRDRIYNWYYHKFVRMQSEYGFTGCVDCNRCVVFCPAHINYRQVLAEVLEEYMRKNK